MFTRKQNHQHHVHEVVMHFIYYQMEQLIHVECIMRYR
jgi:hypothetical protein